MRKQAWLALVVAWALVGCGDDNSASPSGAGGTGGSGGSGSGATAGSGGTGGSTAGSSGSGGSSATGGSGGSSGSGGSGTSGSSGSGGSGATAGNGGSAGTGAVAGSGGVGGSGAVAGSGGIAGTGGSGATAGAGGSGCLDTEYPQYSDMLCGTGAGEMTCELRPQGCPDLYAPTCGCDGNVYGNTCDAASVGVDVSNLGGCVAPQGMFECGGHFCTAGSEYCVETVSDVAGFPSGYECFPLPPICGDTPSCDCLSMAICGDFSCVEVGDGGFMTTCPGG